MQSHIAIGVIGDFDETFTPHAATGPAVEHAAAPLGLAVDVQWLATDVLEADPAQVEAFDALWAAPGSPYKNMNAALEAIRFAREEGVPLLGSCGGCQHVVVEYARNVCGLEGANSTEMDPETPYAVIDLLPEQKEIEDLGGTMRLGAQAVEVAEGTRTRDVYDEAVIHERHRHRYEVNNHFRPALVEAGLVVSGTFQEGRLVEIVELPEHPWFVASQFHPEFKSRPTRPAPLFREFVGAALQRARARAGVELRAAG